MVKKVVVLLSGGLDSATCLSLAINQNYDVYPISFDYGQMNKTELESAKVVADYYDLRQRHKIIKIDSLGEFTKKDKNDEATLKEKESCCAKTYIPARNVLFISYALAYAEYVGADEIHLGLSSADHDDCPECRQEFVDAFQRVLELCKPSDGSGNRIKLVTPIINLTKAETIKLGMEVGVPYELTSSCYYTGEEACGECPNCISRLKGFREAGYIDPLDYKRRNID